jgi:hypothetical protein
MRARLTRYAAFALTIAAVVAAALADGNFPL